MRTECSVLCAPESRFCKMHAFKTINPVAVLIKKPDHLFREARFKVAAGIAYGKGREPEMDLFNSFFFEDIHGRNHDRVEDSLLK